MVRVWLSLYLSISISLCASVWSLSVQFFVYSWAFVALLIMIRPLKYVRAYCPVSVHTIKNANREKKI